MKVSIIIPIYNSEKYLRATLESVLSQTFSDWECILVDDGSTDSSVKICEEYSVADTRFRVVRKENGGVSSARNVGLDTAEGKWICFVDSDDLLTPDAVSHMVKMSEEFDVDVCQCKLTGSVPDTEECKVLSGEERHHLIWACLAFRTKIYGEQGYIIDSPFPKLFKSSLIRKYNLRYVEGLSRSEDAIFDAYCYQYSEKILMCNHSVYTYVNNSESLTHSFNAKLPKTLSRVLVEELKYADMFKYDNYHSAVYVRSFVGMYQIVSEFGEKQLPFKQRVAFLREYLKDDVVHRCLCRLPYRLVGLNFEGRSQKVKLFLARRCQAFLILFWIKMRS